MSEIKIPITTESTPGQELPVHKLEHYTTANQQLGELIEDVTRRTGRVALNGFASHAAIDEAVRQHRNN